MSKITLVSCGNLDVTLGLVNQQPTFAFIVVKDVLNSFCQNTTIVNFTLLMLGFNEPYTSGYL